MSWWNNLEKTVVATVKSVLARNSELTSGGTPSTALPSSSSLETAVNDLATTKEQAVNDFEALKAKVSSFVTDAKATVETDTSALTTTVKSFITDFEGMF